MKRFKDHLRDFCRGAHFFVGDPAHAPPKAGAALVDHDRDAYGDVNDLPDRADEADLDPR